MLLDLGCVGVKAAQPGVSDVLIDRQAQVDFAQVVGLSRGSDLVGPDSQRFQEGFDRAVGRLTAFQGRISVDHHLAVSVADPGLSGVP